MRKIILSFTCLAGLCACQTQHDGYTINGRIAGNSEGMKVQLMDETDYPPTVIDSTVIRQGKFQLKGKIEQPGRYLLAIDKTGAGDPADMLASRFYLENADISYSGHIDSLRTFYWSDESFRKDPVIRGSASQDLFMQYLNSTAALRKESSDINQQYYESYLQPALSGQFNTEAGIALIKRQNEITRQIEVAQWEFIEKNPGTIVGYDLALQFLQGMYVNLTAPQLSRLADIISGAWSARPDMVENFKALVEKARKMAIGEKYQDIELMNPAGEMVKLSEHVPAGKYVMLEFWASWCGPCRGEIPHLRHVYQEYRDKGFEIVSISVDENKADWEKAMKEEKMVWPQLCDPQGLQGTVTQTYNITGVPTCLILDPEGRIFKTDMRGAALDEVLQELYP